MELFSSMTMEDCSMRFEKKPGNTQGKTGLFFCLLSVLLMICTTVFATEYPVAGYANAERVRMRRSASSTSVVLEYIEKGDAVEILGVKGRFYYISYKDRTGYAMKEYISSDAITTTNPTQGTSATPAPVTNNNYKTLERGSTGTEVRALQQALIELGFLKDSIDGTYGQNTQKAVEAFQKKNGYEETGVADGNLQAFLYEKKPKNSAGKSVEVKTLPPIEGATMRQGNMGDAVEKLQQALKNLGYTPGTINGVYHSDTIAAVKAFQKKNGLTADGLAGSATQAKLYSGTALGPDETPKATDTPSSEIPTTVVREGEESSDCKKVQQRLKDLGFLTGAVDGKFGTNSVKALKDFQQAHGLTADGVAGSGTYAILFSGNAKTKSETAPSPTPSPTPLTKENVILIGLGTKGNVVLDLQKRLTELGYYTSRNDGECHAEDVAAIKAFQQANGLKADGKAGYETQVLLYSDRAIGVGGSAPTATPAPDTDMTAKTLRQGDRGIEVSYMQTRLIELGYLSDKADGVFGANTATAVLAFQKGNNLVRDAVAGKGTLTKLYSANAQKAAAATPSPTPAPSSVRQGDSGDLVKDLQVKLIALGYLSGKADGIFGGNTASALLAFQKNNNLKADGIAGSNTFKILSNGNAKPSTTLAPGATATPKPTNPPSTGSFTPPKASSVVYANWYTTIKSKARSYPYATVYDYSTGLSWKVHMFSLGAHADSEPMSAEDTANMMKAFGGKQTWTPKPVWVIFSDGSVFLATTHSMPHDVQHNKTNDFGGHLCIHFPRTLDQVKAIGPYATSHQVAVDKAWEAMQK